jgi:hypothetical protein
MNKFQELLAEVGTDVSGKWVSTENTLRLAELIAKECMTICEDVAERNDPAIACYYEIKRTFRS